MHVAISTKLLTNIAADNLSSALRFIRAAQAIFGLLSENPEVGAIAELSSERLAGLRHWRIKGFKNHIVFYLVGKKALTVLRVLHGARDIEAIFEQNE